MRDEGARALERNGVSVPHNQQSGTVWTRHRRLGIRQKAVHPGHAYRYHWNQPAEQCPFPDTVVEYSKQIGDHQHEGENQDCNSGQRNDDGLPVLRPGATNNRQDCQSRYEGDRRSLIGVVSQGVLKHELSYDRAQRDPLHDTESAFHQFSFLPCQPAQPSIVLDLRQMTHLLHLSAAPAFMKGDPGNAMVQHR